MKTKVQFLVNEKMQIETADVENDLFAYFPDMNHDLQGAMKTCYSHIGQHSACNPGYAKESRPATPEEYKDLYTELTDLVGYDLEII